MQLVAVMEAEVGTLETWPSEILALIFAFELRGPNVLVHLQKILAYFFGNNVPFNLACQFFSACAYIPIPWTVPRFRYHYELFTDHRSLSRCRSYNVREGRVMYTDGTFEEEDVPVTIGFDGTGFPTMINSILIQAQQYEYDESAVYP